MNKYLKVATLMATLAASIASAMEKKEYSLISTGFGDLEKGQKWDSFKKILKFGDFDTLGNKANTPFEVRDALTNQVEVWPTAEHYYQAQKFNYPFREKIRALPKEELLKFVSEHQSSPEAFTPEEWKKQSLAAMREAIEFKFKNNIEALKKLKGTGDAVLVFEIPDSFWGSGANMQGENWLGRLIMQFRSYITKKPIKYDSPETAQPKQTEQKEEMTALEHYLAEEAKSEKYGRVLPVNKSTLDGKWYGLFTKDTEKGPWIDFISAKYSGPEKASVYAAKALKDATDGEYNVTIVGNYYPWLKEHINGVKSFFHFVPVKRVPGNTLYHKSGPTKFGGSGKKADFRWIAIEDVINEKSDGASVDKNLKEVIKRNWYEEKQKPQQSKFIEPTTSKAIEKKLEELDK